MKLFLKSGPGTGLVSCLLVLFLSVIACEGAGLIYQESQGSPWLNKKTPTYNFSTSVSLTGPAKVIVDFGGNVNCQSSGGLSSNVKLSPTIDGKDAGMAGYMKPMLGTKSDATSSISGTTKLVIPAGAHLLGLRADGMTYNDSSPGCTFYGVWIRVIPQ